MTGQIEAVVAQRGVGDLRQLLRRFERLANARDTRPLADQVLDLLDTLGPLPATGVRRLLGRCQRDVYAALRRLESNGLIRRQVKSNGRFGRWEVVSTSRSVDREVTPPPPIADRVDA